MHIMPSCRTVWVVATVVALCGLDTLTAHAQSAPRPVAVGVDIQPQACPNVLNVEAAGVLQVAVLGTEHFDVTSVDPATVRLAGVAPLRWTLEDVAASLAPLPGLLDGWDCTAEGADGFLDLTLEFDSQEVAQALADALGSRDDTDGVVVRLDGALFDGTPIGGEDMVILVEGHSRITKATIPGLITDPFPVPPSCGPGETSVGSICIPNLTSCGPGETSVGSTCISNVSTGGRGGGGGGGCAMTPGGGVDPTLAGGILAYLGWKRTSRRCRTKSQPARDAAGRETALR
jgi:hypothetical protein